MVYSPLHCLPPLCGFRQRTIQLVQQTLRIERTEPPMEDMRKCSQRSRRTGRITQQVFRPTQIPWGKQDYSKADG